MILRRFIFICLLVSFASSANGKVIFENLPMNIQQKLRATYPQIESGKLTQSTVDQILRDIAVQPELENVVAEKSDFGEWTIRVILKRVVGEILFTGNENLSTSVLKEVLKIEKAQKFNRSLAIQSGENLKQIYGEHGFFNTHVEMNLEQKPNGQVDVHFNIKENAPCRVKKINIFSDNLDVKEQIEYVTKEYLKKNLTQELLDQMVRKIQTSLREKYYLTATIKDPKITYQDDKTSAIFFIEIKNPIKWQFNIEGNKKKNLSELYKALNLTAGERKSMDPVSESIDRLRPYYLEEGFPHVKIDSRVTKFDTSFIHRVYLEVDEGPRVSIERFKIEGRISRPKMYYIKFIEDHSSEILGRGYYNRDSLDKGLDNLVVHLKNQGFLKAKIQSLRVEFSEDKSKATVILNMDEGALTQIRSITFEGNAFFSSRELIEVFGLETRSPLKLNELEQGIEKIKSFYLRQGFMEMKLLNEDETLVSYNDKGTLAEINFRLYEGPRIRVADIVLEGNTFTKSYVIRQEAGIEVGEVLTPQKLEETTDRLNRLGIFSRVEVRTLEEGTSIADRTLVISVAERDPGVFRIGAGVNSERNLTARGFIGMGYSNLWGTARAVSGRVETNYNLAQINYPEYEVSVGYLEPFLLNTRNRGRVNFSRSERVFNYSSTSGLTSITQSDRAEFNLERQFTKHVRGSWTLWSIDRRKDFEKEGRCIDPVDPFSQCPSTVQQIAKIGPLIDLDYRDNPFLPTKGHFTRATLEYSHKFLGSTEGIHFYKTDAQHSRYLRLGDSKVIWANSVRGGYIKSFAEGDGAGVPANQAFFLGGVFTVRGFDTSTDNNRIPPIEIKKSTSIIVNDDSYYGLIKSELRFPISGEHGGVIFYDGGIVGITNMHFDRPYRDSVGFGYRYNTPVGPVSIDLAFKINPRLEENVKEEPFRVHFSIGTF